MIKTGSLWGAMAAGALVIGVAAGCGFASYDERMTYLRTIADRGVEVHDLIVSQEGTINAERCNKAFEAVHDWNETPNDRAGIASEEWKDQIQAFFVDSCVSGVPKQVGAPGAEQDQ